MRSKMAASHGSGCQSPPTIGRTVDRVFEEAQFTGEILLNGRKLRDYPKLCAKYDLSDTVLVDISRNRLTEVPHEVCEYLYVEKINCYHNVIRSIPDTIQQLQALTQLNLSRNQLSVLPAALCLLGSLEVLSASNNRLVSLPEEIGQLKSLMDLDVSCNEIAHLPLQIGDLSSLRSLNLRRNKLVELPVEISRLQLYRLDFSSNRIEKIPTVFRKMETLEQFILDHNPLSSPPANICIKGKQHIMKYLHIEAVKEDRKRGILMSSDSDIKRFIHKSLPPQQTSEDFKNILGAPESKWKRHTVLSNDSGYSTGDGSERNGWQSGEIYPLTEENNSRRSDSFRKDRDTFSHYRNYQPHARQHSEHYQQHQNPGPSSNAVDAVSRSRSGSGVNQQLLSSVTREQIYSEPVTAGGVPLHISSRSHFQHQHWYPYDSARMQYRSHPHVIASSSHTHSSDLYSSSSSTSGYRTITPSPAIIGQSHENQNHSLNNSFSGSESGVGLSRHRSNTSLSDYQHRQQPSYSHVTGSRPDSPSPRYAGAKPAVDHYGNNFLSSPPRSQAGYTSQREYSPPNRNIFRPLSSRSEQVGGESPPMTPPTPPIIMTGDLEDEFTRELKRQKAEYERKKKQAELIRVQQEEEEEREKEERRRTALRLQEEQRLLKERAQEEHRKHEELLWQEEMRRQEDLKLQEAKKRKEEEAEVRRREEEIQRLQETVRVQGGDEIRQKDEVQKRPESKLTDKITWSTMTWHDNTSNTLFLSRYSTNIAPQHYSRPQHPPPPPPPPSSSSSTSSSHQPPPPSFLPMHGFLPPMSPSASSSPSSSPYHMSRQHQDGSSYINNDNDNRNALSSQSFKEQRRLAGGTQYRRAASDTLKTLGQSTNTQHQVDSLNYINRNGVLENSRVSSTSTTPSVSPSPSPRNSVSHLAKPNSPNSSTSHLAKPISPSGSTSHLVKPTGGKSSVPRVSNGPAAPAQSQVVRRTKVAGDRSNTSSPVTARSTRTMGAGSLRPQGSALNPNPAPSNLRRSSNSSTTDDDAKPRKVSSSMPLETSRLKSRLDEQNKRGALQSSAVKKTGAPDSVDTNKRINTRPPTNIYAMGRGRAAGPKALDDSTSNFSARRKEEKEEAEQMDRLRQTVESRLRVTLPDNLAEALRDGVVLCHLANQIRPRSVGSIHVPSPAVPKLTLAKCRRNVDNFLDACKKIGVDQEQLCGPQDIFDEKGISKVAITVAALVAIGTNPRQSAV